MALARALRLADTRSFPADRARWLAVRDEIDEETMTKGWSEERQAFVQHCGSTSLDASNLMMPLVFFLSPSDPRNLKTLEATLRPPREGGLVANSLVYRYNVEETKVGASDLASAELEFPGWLGSLLTHEVDGLESYAEMMRLLIEEKEAIKVLVNVTKE